MTDPQTKEEVEERYAGRRATFSIPPWTLTGTIDCCHRVRQDGVAIVVLELDGPLGDEFNTPLEYLDVEPKEESDE